MTVLAGTNNNGQLVDVDFTFFKGQVGMQERGGYVEFAYVGKLPGGGPLTGKIDGKVYNVLTSAKSAIAVGMVVVKAQPQA